MSSLSSDSVSDSNTSPFDGMPLAIQVKFGELSVAAVLCSVGLSIMHEKVYQQIKVTNPQAIVSQNTIKKKYVYDVFNEHYKILEDVEMNITLVNQLVPVSILIMKNLHIDLVLGRDFINYVRPVLHVELNFFKWSYNIINMIPFVKNKQSLVAISNEGNAPEIIIAEFNYKYKRQEEQVWTEQMDISPISTENDEKQIEEILVKLNLDEEGTQRQGEKRKKKRSRRRAKKNAQKKEQQNIDIDEDSDDATPWTKIYVTDTMTCEENGDINGFYAIYWLDNFRSNHIVKCKLNGYKSVTGLHFEALFHVFEEGILNGFDDKLHIISDNKSAIELFKAYYHEEIVSPFQAKFDCENDQSGFASLCMISDNYPQLKLEYIPREDNTVPEMVRLRKKLQKEIPAFKNKK